MPPFSFVWLGGVGGSLDVHFLLLCPIFLHFEHLFFFLTSLPTLSAPIFYFLLLFFTSGSNFLFFKMVFQEAFCGFGWVCGGFFPVNRSRHGLNYRWKNLLHILPSYNNHAQNLLDTPTFHYSGINMMTWDSNKLPSIASTRPRIQVN